MIEISLSPRRQNVNVSLNNGNKDINIGTGQYIPQINGVAIVGNKTMTEILADGLMIDGLNADWVDPQETEDDT